MELINGKILVKVFNGFSVVAKIIIIANHELYTLIVPYSSVVRIRVNIGVVIIDIPRCIMLQIANQIEAFAGLDIALYRFINCCKIISPANYIVPIAGIS